MRSPKCFKYRAFDCNNTIHEGNQEAESFEALAISLRNRGLQILDATTVASDGKLAEDRFEKMKRRVHPEDQDPMQTKPLSLPIRLLFMLINLLFFRHS